MCLIQNLGALFSFLNFSNPFFFYHVTEGREQNKYLKIFKHLASVMTNYANMQQSNTIESNQAHILLSQK